MEGPRRHRRLLVAALAPPIALAWVFPAAAEPDKEKGPSENRTTVRAGTDPARGSVVYEVRDEAIRNPTPGPRRRGGRRCTAMPISEFEETYQPPVDRQLAPGVSYAGLYDDLPQLNEPDPDGDAEPYVLVCEGRPVGLGWRQPRRPPGPRTTPEAIARWARDEIPMPGVEIRANPGTGVAGLEAWFWADGYSGEPILERRGALGRTIEVEATPTSYLWDFGDGTPFLETKTLGVPYPARSDVRHSYEGMSAGFPVVVRFLFDVRYRVDGGDWVPLAPIERVASTSYRVGEIRSVVTSRG